MRPIYILASERSGTNLLRQRLMEYAQTHHGAPPLHILKHLYFNAFKYSSNRELTEAIYQLSQIHFAPWDATLASKAKDDVDATTGTNTNIVQLAHQTYLRYAELNGFQSYICKDNHLFKFAEAIERDVPDVLFVYLFRDPRDVVLSEKKRPCRTLTLQQLAGRWADEQRACLSIILNHRRDKAIPVSYEQLISNEAVTIQGILRIAGSTPGKKRSKTVESGYSKEWENLRKGTLTSNTEKWRHEFSDRAVQRIERECYSEMIALGYEPEFSEESSRYSNCRVCRYIRIALLRVKAMIELRSKSERWRSERSAVTRSVRSKKIDPQRAGLVFRED